MYSNQEETDTRVILYLHHAVSLGYKNAVVRSPDTDIFVILLFHAHKIKLNIFLDTGSGKHRKLINISEMAKDFGPEYCSSLLGLYVFTGEDCTIAFEGKGKVAPLRKTREKPPLSCCIPTTWRVLVHYSRCNTTVATIHLCDVWE